MEALKKLYMFKVNDSAVSFVRRGIEYNISLSSTKMAMALPYLQAKIPTENIERLTGIGSKDLELLKNSLRQEGLVDDAAANNANSESIYIAFREAFQDWMREAFSSKYWEIMLSGKGSRELYIGYLFELYHYTKNANRHMPLIVAYCPSEFKEVKKLLAKHYFEEWNHYDFFSDALFAMGISKKTIEMSDPLPSTLEMSNFMRQAASTSPLCYAICSAILEGTTEDSGSYGEYFRKIAPLYKIPDEAIQPLFDHLALDADYGHKSLFEDICLQFPDLTRREAERAFSFGRQMVDHIYMWTEQIHRHYGNKEITVRRKFDLSVD